MSADYRDLYERAADRAGREYWEPVEEDALRAEFGAAGFGQLLAWDGGMPELAGVEGWSFVDVSADGEPTDNRWYYASGDEPRPDEFRRFHELLVDAAPDEYEPWYFRVERAGKAPATQFGSWKHPDSRLSVKEAVDWMEQGGNVGLAGTGPCRGCGGRASDYCPHCEGEGFDGPLVNIDIDDDEETTPADLPDTLRARSRSRSGWHAWAFDENNGSDDEIPNIPTDDAGEIRASWQYVVAAGSFVPSTAEEIPDEFHDNSPGYYTVADDHTVATFGYDDLPEVFRDLHENGPETVADVLDDSDAPDTPDSVESALDGSDGDESDAVEPDSDVFGLTITDVPPVPSRRASDRFSAVWHDSDTGSNMSVSTAEGTVSCWRHTCSHGPLQALAIFNDNCEYGCKALGKGMQDDHGNWISDTRENVLKGHWKLVWFAWAEAKRRDLIDADDPVPHRALLGRAVDDGVIDADAVVERGDDGDSYQGFPGVEAYNDAVRHVRDEYDLDPGREPVDADPARGGWGVETCTAPAVDRQSFDRRDHWAHLQGERFDETLAADGPVVWADPAGSGKTTNAARAAADRDEPHYVSFQNHRKAREFQIDDATPDGYYHLRGGAQKRHDDCLDVDHAGEDCPDHGDTRDCPHMCPVYDLDNSHPTRQLYDAVKEALGPVEAHLLLTDPLAAEAGHDDDGHCPWLNQFADVANESRVVGVHEYLTLKTVRDPSDGPTRQVVVDEYAGAERVATDTELGVEKLTRADRFLDRLGATDTEREVFDVLAAFVRDLRDAVADSGVDDPLAAVDDPTDDLGEIADDRRVYVDSRDPADLPDWAEPHEVQVDPAETVTSTVEVDPDDLPGWADPDDVSTEKYDPNPGNEHVRRMETRHVVERERHREERLYVETDGVAELLARAAITYREALRTRFEHNPEGVAGVPCAADALVAVVADVCPDADRSRRLRRAMNAPTSASTCPRYGSDLVRVSDDPLDWSHIGGHDCEECGWNSDRNTYLAAVDRPARATAWVTSDADGTDTGVTVRRLPEPDSLPDDPLLLDATARPDPVAGLFDVPVDDVTVYGDEPAAYDGLEVTQVVDGQYHPGTLKRSESARERVATTLRKLGSAHGDVLVVGPKRLYTMFSEALPEGTEWLSYHATRGLNRAQYDAVVCVGAPHPRVADLRRNAGLLAQGHDDLRRGGEEHSTRRDARPPVYRRLDYRDDDGDGRAVPTKHYAGLTGELFQQSREDELVQAVHRIRPLLAEGDETNHAYLLTNVPTPLPVDTLATFDELAEPLRALLPVHDGALRLAEYVGEIEAGDGPDGFRATAFVEGDEWRVDELHRLAAANGETVGERQVRRWVDDLAEIGLLDAGSYEPRAGVPYEPADESTLTRALQVLRGDGGVEVALQRRFAKYLREAESLADWLGWARRNLAVTGEVERWATADSDGAPPG